MMKDTIYVIDTSGFIVDIRLPPTSIVTVPAVVDEIIDRNTKLRFDLLHDAGLLVDLPYKEYKDIVRSTSISTGDETVLSDTDIDILAKALELSKRSTVILITDDYAVQNVAAILNIKYQPAATSGIKKKIKWELRCTGCGSVARSGTECPICASEIKRYRVK